MLSNPMKVSNVVGIFSRIPHGIQPCVIKAVIDTFLALFSSHMDATRDALGEEQSVGHTLHSSESVRS